MPDLVIDALGAVICLACVAVIADVALRVRRLVRRGEW